VRLLADANVLLSAVIGGRARLIIQHPQVSEILTTEFTFAEVHEYAGVLARKKRLAPDIVLLAVAALPLTVINRETYRRRLAEAAKRVGPRDPDDAELLALALHLDLPIWSNDRDFEQAGIELFTTEDLLRELGIIE
jgi:predicted nucleic acid-binding protein